MTDTPDPPATPGRRRPVFARPNLPLLMLQARERVVARFRPLLNAHGVTEQQWRILRVLMDRGAQEPRELVLACGLSSPSLAGILARMEADGLVSRVRMAHDQRRVRVSTTARSRALAREVAPLIDAAYAEIEARLGTDFVGGLARTLEAMIAALDPPAYVDDAAAQARDADA